jgi:TrpR-related protein YerC/YecD
MKQGLCHRLKHILQGANPGKDHGHIQDRRKQTAHGNVLHNKNLDFLFKAVLALENVEECYDFFEDLCTVQELNAISQRIVVAKMLSEKCVYTDIVNETGASTATISRVNRSLQYGCDGYDKIFERIDRQEQGNDESV